MEQSMNSKIKKVFLLGLISLSFCNFNIQTTQLDPENLQRELAGEQKREKQQLIERLIIEFANNSAGLNQKINEMKFSILDRNDLLQIQKDPRVTAATIDYIRRIFRTRFGFELTADSE
jgi:hypothetical protein